MIIIINGKGASGKDTIIQNIQEMYDVANITSIAPALKASIDNNWLSQNPDAKNYVKSEKGRRFLSKLNKLLDDEFDISMKYLLKECHCKQNVKFVHIREPENIEDFKTLLSVAYSSEKVITLLVKSDRTEDKIYGNPADDRCEDYEYDEEFINNYSLEKLKEASIDFFWYLMDKYKFDAQKKEAASDEI